MKSWLRRILIVTGTVVALLVLLGQHYVLDSAKLDEAVKTEVPLGKSCPWEIDFRLLPFYEPEGREFESLRAHQFPQ